MPANNLDIFLRIVLDEAAKQRAVQGINDVNQASMQGTEEARRAQLKESTILLDDAMNLSGQRVKLSDKEADAIIANTQRVAQVQRLQSRETLKLADAINIASQAALVTGGAITGGLFALAVKYNKDAKDATQQTYEWAAATRLVGEAGDRVGAVVTDVVLPNLKKAAELADSASKFVQQHPDIVRAALNIGGALVAIGTVGTLISKGIRMYADFQFIAAGNQQVSAAQLQLEASLNQLEAAGIARESGLLGGGLAGSPVGKVGGALGQVALYASAVILGAGIGEQLGNAIAGAIYGKNYKKQNLGDAAVTATRMFFENPVLALELGITKLGIADQKVVAANVQAINSLDKWVASVTHASAAADGAGQSIDNLGATLGQLKGSPHEQEIVSAYEDMLKKIDESTAQYSDQRLKIIQEEGKAEVKAAADLQARINDINQQYGERVATIQADAARAEAQAQQQYNDQRSQIVRDFHVQEERAEQDHQRKLLQLEHDHNQRVFDLAENRDALGLVKEQQNYQDQVSQENQQYQLDQQRRKQDEQLRLRDLQRNYLEEKQQRAQQLAENLAQAAAQHAQELAQAQAQYKEQVKQMQDNEKDKLAELDKEHRDEIAKLRQGFYDMVKETDQSLLGPEIKLRQQAYSIMLQDAQNFLNQYGQIMTGTNTGITGYGGGGGGGTNKHDYTGYAYTGLYKMAQDGLPEFVLGGKATQAAEKLVGGKLTEDMLMAALVGLNPKTVNYQDNRRFSHGIGAEDRRRIERDTKKLLEGLFA